MNDTTMVALRYSKRKKDILNKVYGHKLNNLIRTYLDTAFLAIPTDGNDIIIEREREDIINRLKKF